MLEFEVGLVDGGKMNFDQSFLPFNVKKKKKKKKNTCKQLIEKNILKLTVNAQ